MIILYNIFVIMSNETQDKDLKNQAIYSIISKVFKNKGEIIYV